jgi:hypothetical protein
MRTKRVCDHMKAGAMHLHNLNVRVLVEGPEEADTWVCDKCNSHASSSEIFTTMDDLGLIRR